MTYKEWYNKYVVQNSEKNGIIEEKRNWLGLKNISDKYSKPEAIKRLKDRYQIEYKESSQYKMNEILMSKCVTWLDSFSENFTKFMENNPCKIPKISVKAPSKMKNSIGCYSYYLNSTEVVELSLNGKYHSNVLEFEKYVELSVNSEWYPKNAKIHKTFVHEFGHHVANSLMHITNSKSWEKDFIESCIKEFNKSTGKDIKSFMEMSEFVSRYGATSPSELFAETFAEYFGGENPREFAVIFGTKLEKILKEVK